MIFNETFCEKCNNSFLIPNFSLEEKKKFNNEYKFPLRSILYIKEKYKMDLKTSKLIVLHFNHSFGVCHNCNKQSTKEDVGKCPFCKSLNINL